MRMVLVTGDAQLGTAFKELVEQAAPGQHEAAVANYQSALSLVEQRKPDVVFMEVPDPAKTALDCARRLRREIPDLPIVVVGCRGGEQEILDAMRAGACEYLRPPLTVESVRETIAQLGRIQLSGAGTLTAVFSSTGGSGVTTITVNMAVELAGMSGKKVAAVDLVLGHGDLALFLDLEPRYTVADVTANMHRLDSSFLLSSLSRHSEQLYVMAAPKRVEEIARIGAHEIGSVLGHLRLTFSHTVMDAGHELDERTMAVLDAVDHLLLVVVPSVASLRNAERCLDVFLRLGYGEDKISLVVNRVAPRSSISPKMISEALGRRALALLPEQGAVPAEAANRGIPLDTLAPRSGLVRSLRELTGELFRLNGHGETKN